MKSAFSLEDLRGKKITIMGLGLNGGGIETCRFLARHGAEVTVTDLRTEDILAPSIERIADCGARLVLGRHDEEDFRHADMVIKNPAVRPNNPFVALARHVETDLSLFLNLIDNPVIGVTGSKGKSTTATAIHHGLLLSWPGARLGGNITISPLSFFEELDGISPVVLELSSFQLGDLSRSKSWVPGKGLKAFPPRIAVMTNIFHDHQDYYGAMEPYLADKAVLFTDQDPGAHALFRADDPYGIAFASTCRSNKWMSESRPGQGLLPGTRGAWLDAEGRGWFDRGQGSEEILPRDLVLPGQHHRGNLLQAALALRIFGIEAGEIRERMGTFGGIEHRLEPCGSLNGVRFINDSAATIPEAALAAVRSIGGKVHLITGGTDKALDLTPFADIGREAGSICLLKGSATDKAMDHLKASGTAWEGPFDSIDAALSAAWSKARPGDTVMLSPGCASFGLFLNEFDRGRRFKAAVAQLIAASSGPGTNKA